MAPNNYKRLRLRIACDRVITGKVLKLSCRDVPVVILILRSTVTMIILSNQQLLEIALNV